MIFSEKEHFISTVYPIVTRDVCAKVNTMNFKSKYYALQKIKCLITNILQLESEYRFCTDSLVFKK